MTQFKRFLVFFWTIWWLIAFITNVMGTGQFWGVFSGTNLLSDYGSIAIACGKNWLWLCNLIFALSLVLQAWLVVSFIRTLVCMGGEQGLARAKISFGLSTVLFMLMYGGFLVLQLIGASFSSHVVSTMRMVVLQFLCAVTMTTDI